ncbi:MAG TPA: Gfo/Idh/MocA family oxidoreductase, partial [Longimicrobiaceae bacterium]|nr:Gfo/Idh/MocA family oxidoreductase [Longimicrobiaceae bacterium]
WRCAASCAPIILTKSSHDLDIIHWLLGQTAVSVASYGNLGYFRRENAPPEAADRCVDCPLQETCLYSATRFYRHSKEGWPFEVIAPPPDTLADRVRAIEEGPYGRCVWRNDNDVCDNQTVILEFESGIHATFGLQGLTADNTRKITILFDKGELTGDLHQSRITISHFTGEKDHLEIEEVPLPDTGDSHGGGDLHLLYALHSYLTRGEHSEVVTSLRSSIPSHVLAFLAEDSRTKDNVKLPVPDVLLPSAVAG